MPTPNAHDPLRTTNHTTAPISEASPESVTTDARLGPSVAGKATGTFQPRPGETRDGSAAMLAEPPPSIPGYEIEGLLGRGGMGVVYKALHLALKRTVALKMVLAGRYAGPSELARFRIEAEAVARLQHPNIVQIHDVGETGGCPYIALEFVAGGNLASKITGKPMSARDSARLVEAVARAIQLAHSRNVVHRDLKPANILLAADGTAKITDFGLARQLDCDSGETHVGDVMGTPSYMAPEQASGRAHAAGPATDIYALGAILYDCLTGRPPFRGQSVVETLDQVRTQEPVPPSRWRKGVPLDLETICLKCLRKEPEKRYASAAELADELGRYLRGEPILARPVGRVERLLLWARRRPAAAAVGVLVVLVVVLGGLGSGAAWLWQQAEQARRTLADASDQTEKALQGERFAREQADRARLGETAANEKLTAANGRLEQVLYLRRIWLAHVGWRENNLAKMEQELLACPLQRRRWEWYYLDHLRHAELQEIRFRTDGMALVLSRDGGRIAASASDGFVRVWDVATGKEVLALPGHSGLRRCLCFSPDGSLLAADSDRKALKIWDTRTGQLVHTLPHESVTTACFSPDGHTVATSGADDAVHFWDSRTGEQTRVVPDLAKWSHIKQLSFSPDGQLLAVVAAMARVWDVAAGKELSPFMSPGGTPTGVCFSSDGRRLATTWAGGAVRLSDARTGKVQASPKDQVNPQAVCLSPDGNLLATGASDRIVRLWDARTGEPIRTFQGHTGSIRCLAFSADGQRLVSAAEDGLVKVWDASTDQEARRLEGATTGTHLCFSSNSQRLAAVGQDGMVRVWDTRTGLPLRDLAGKDGNVVGVGFGGAGLRVVRRLSPHGVTVRDDETDQPARILGGDTDDIGKVCLSPDGRRLAAIFRNEVRLWDAETGQFLRTLKGPRLAFACLGFSPDGRTLAAGCMVEGDVHVWDVRTGESRCVLTGHTGTIHGVAFHPDADRLASIAVDGTVRAWDLATGKEIDRRTAGVEPLANGAGGVCWSPDGQRLVGVWGRGTMHLWDVLSGEEVLTLPGDGTGHANRERLCFSPDGRLLAACHDGTVRLWETRVPQEEGPR